MATGSEPVKFTNLTQIGLKSKITFPLITHLPTSTRYSCFLFRLTRLSTRRFFSNFSLRETKEERWIQQSLSQSETAVALADASLFRLINSTRLFE